MLDRIVATTGFLYGVTTFTERKRRIQRSERVQKLDKLDRLIEKEESWRVTPDDRATYEEAEDEDENNQYKDRSGSKKTKYMPEIHCEYQHSISISKTIPPPGIQAHAESAVCYTHIHVVQRRVIHSTLTPSATHRIRIRDWHDELIVRDGVVEWKADGDRSYL